MPKPDPRLDELLSGPSLDLDDLLRWLLEASPVETVDAEPARTSRLRRLQAALAERELLPALGQAWQHASAVRLLADTGLPDRTTLLGEGFRRLVDRVIPRLDQEGDLYALVYHLRLTEADAAWIEGLPDDLLAPLGSLLKPGDASWVRAARLVAHRAAAVGLSQDLLALGQVDDAAGSPFFDLPRVVQACAEGPGDAAAQADWAATQRACQEALALIHAGLESRGTSTDLVFRLELLEAALRRIEVLLACLADRGKGPAFAAELVRAAATQRSLVALFRTTVKRLGRKMVEHTGDTGEHYIARDRREWRAMAWSAAGGGVVTAGTAFLKYGITALPLAPLVMGLSLALNYTLSFFVMQLLGFSLASKQPAMTAAALARSLENGEHQDREIDLVAAISRTQFIAAVGNVFAAIPTALVVALLWIGVANRGPLGLEAAVHSLEGSLPLRGWTLVFAAFTGVLLWLSSLATGWAANWSAFRRLPEAIAQHRRLRRLVGARQAEALGFFVQRHISGLAGYVALGLLLAFAPMVFAFAGIHMEVRHVTLQSASLALASASLWAHGALSWSLALQGLLGVAGIGALNFAVSFLLSLWMALRARDLNDRATRGLWAGLFKALLRTPGRFILPPRPPASA